MKTGPGLSDFPVSTGLGEAERLDRRGETRPALKALSRALRRASPDPELLLLRGRLHARNGRYRRALADLGRAIRLAPGREDLLLERAAVLVLDNDLSGAQADLARALKLRPDDARARFQRVRLQLKRGRWFEAARELARLSRGGGARAAEARLHLGMLRWRRGLRRRALADFAAALKESGDGAAAMRARFYWLAANACARSPEPRLPGPRLYLCGLGLFPPYTATAEVLRALSCCDALINNISESETKEVLDVFGTPTRSVTYIDGGNDRHVMECVFKELRRGRIVGFVTRGHAMIFGTLGSLLVERCRREGIPVQPLPSLSSIDALLCRAGLGEGRALRAAQTLDHAVVEGARRLETGHPLIVSFNSEPIMGRRVRAVESALRRFYPARHACWMFGPKYDAAPRAVRVDELARSFPEINASLMLYVPALGGARG